MEDSAMADEPITDDTVRALRTSWFAYLDTVETLHPALHAYGLKLTGSVWDAEDLVQDTLLRAFAMIGRGDLHGPGSPVANPRAYLFRTATNLWLDSQRRQARERTILAEPRPGPEPAAPEAVRAAGEQLFARLSPQARAAVILKDVFEFSLEEMADQLRTTVGGVKSALHRGRDALGAQPAAAAASDTAGPSRELVDRFIDAFHARDVARITATITQACSIEVPGVGGGRGRRGGWAEASAGHTGVRLERGAYRGETVVLAFNEEPEGPDTLYDVMRLEEVDGLVSRLINYCFCPETVRLVAAELGLAAKPWGYHQPADVLPRMIATSTLPWGEGMKLH
jgi:RNA polymerase sigma-70 factor (ECF subfamily)